MPESSGQSEIDAAVKLHQAGKIDRAARAYRQILEQRPDDANALHLLGVTELQSGHFEQAVELIARAIERQPNVGVYHINLAAALRALRRVDDAIGEAEKGIVLDEKLAPQGYHIAALAFVDGGQPQDALDCWVKALKARPEFAEAHLSIASLMDGIGNYFHATLQRQYAEEIARKEVAREPDSAAAHLLLGQSLEQGGGGGKLEEAVTEYRAATRLLPHDANVFHALGRALRRSGQAEEAITVLRFALRMNPKLAEAHGELGATLMSQGRVAEAIEALRASLTLLSNQPETRARLADALARAGEIEQAVSEARQAASEAPNSPGIASTLLRTLMLDARVSPRELFDACVEWDRRHGKPLQSAVHQHVTVDLGMGGVPPVGRGGGGGGGGGDDAAQPPALPVIDRDPDRPLRIGFVSPHFRRGALAKLLMPLLEGLDRSQFHVALYSDAGASDDVTAEFKKRVGGWRETAALTDTQLALRIREDRIDILIDLSGHGEGNRMLAFAQQPAPVQITQMIWPFTTGVSAIGFCLSDDIADPPGEADSLHVEKLVRLPRPAICYRPWEPTAPRIDTRRASEPIAFGVVGDVAHFSPAAIETWAKVMSQVADSRLLVMSSTRDIDATRALLTRRGIPQFRLAIVPPEEGPRYLDFFNSGDIVLDTFPVSGLADAGDALFMGRPIVTLASDAMPASRRAAVFLHSAGFEDLIATTPQQYVEIATRLAGDRARLGELTHSLRNTLLRSRVCDAAGCAAAMMSFYRDAWRAWCASGHGWVVG